MYGTLPVKRWVIQFIFLVVQHPFIQNFLTGTIYRGPLKAICTSTLTCYSCPAAPFSCPIGTIQYLIEYMKMVPTYAIGTLTLFGTFWGRAPCSYACPFGFLQDILYRVSPFSYQTRLSGWARHLKWPVLVLLVLIIPYWKEIPAFCAWLCPAGTLQAGIPIVIANPSFRSGIGITFVWKAFLLLAVLLYSLRVQRPFCRYLCPLGLFLGFFNRVSILQITRDKKRCLSCGVCGKKCPMGLLLPRGINSLDCIKCGSCIAECPPKIQALSWKFSLFGSGTKEQVSALEDLGEKTKTQN